MSDAGHLNARIVYWGPAGSGKSTNLRLIHQKLRADHRGDLRSMPTGIDPSVHYEILPIELGNLGGVETRIQVVAVPSGAEQSVTRKQLLDGVAGVVLVLDPSGEHLEANLHSVAELREALSAYGRSLEEVPCVIQYNKRDASEPFGMEELHRRLALEAPVFEAVAEQGSGVLQTLTTVSKLVVRSVQEGGIPAASSGPAPLENEAPARQDELDALDIEEKEVGSGLCIVSAGEPVVQDGNRLALSLVLEDDAGRTHQLNVSVDLRSVGTEA